MRSNLWEEAAKAGLVLGLTSTAYLFITQALSGVEMPLFINTAISLILWTAKFGGCIWLMMIFMRRFASKHSDAGNSHIFKLGIIISLLSSLVYATASFANLAYISTDMLAETTELLRQQMAPLMDSNTTSQLDKMMENMPQITFFSNLIYCFLYGTILSFILSRNIPKRNPFGDYTSLDEQ